MTFQEKEHLIYVACYLSNIKDEMAKILFGNMGEARVMELAVSSTPASHCKVPVSDLKDMH